MTHFRQNAYRLFERTVLPLTERASNFSTLAAIRSALIITLPIVLLGSLAELLNSFPLPAYRIFMLEHFGPHWPLFGQELKNATFGVISLVMLFTVGHHLAERFNARNPLLHVSPVIAGLVSFVSFLCLLRQDLNAEALTLRWLGVSGLCVAVIAGLLSTRLFLLLFSYRKLHLRLQGGTPDPALPQAFNALIPGMLTVLVFAACGTLTQIMTEASVPELMYQLIRMPFDGIRDGLGRGILYIGSLHALWFAGVHGANVLDPITHDIYGAAVAANEAAAAAGLPLPHIMTKTFMDTFVFMGGAGTTLCLTAALILFGKTQAHRRIGFISLVPGLFNINEVLLFGLPIVLNPLMLIPFIGTPLVLACTSYVAVSVGLVPGASASVEWTTPLLLNAYLSTGSLYGPILQLINLIIGTLVYVPFVALSNAIDEKRAFKAFRLLMTRACAVRDAGVRCADHRDDAGALARGLIEDMDYAHAKGTGLHLEFQPQVSAVTGRVVGVESLLRWQHTTYGPVPAPITIALAEDSGLIRPLGLWIFETACRVRRSWLDAGIEHLNMAVNISALQLTRALPQQLMDILHRYNLRPGMLELEVTESGALDADTPESLVLSHLYNLGFLIAIDDFGMGHSSLKYLKQFPVTAVKIDGAISRDVVTNPICADIVAAITRLCRARKMTSVAEFVENEEQIAILRDLGCDVLQGYRYSKSLPADACLAFIRSNYALTAPDPGTESGEHSGSPAVK